MNEKSELESLRDNLFDDVKEVNRDKLLIGVIFYMLAAFLFYRGLGLIYPGWYENLFFRVLNFSLSFCWALIPLLIARQLKDPDLRRTGIIVGSIYLILSGASTIGEIINYLF